MEYVMSSQWSLMERFEITDTSGAPQFEASMTSGGTGTGSAGMLGGKIL